MGSEKDGVQGAKELLPARAMAGPLALIFLTPPFIVLLWYMSAHDASPADVYTEWAGRDWDVAGWFYDVMPNPFDPLAWQIIAGYIVVQLVLMKYVPGHEFHGPETASGHVPIYNANGMQVYVINLVGLVVLTYLGIIHPEVVYYKMGELLMAMNVFALVFCLVLYFKGLIAPSGKDCGSSGNMIIDYFWGTELYPRIFGWDVKVFTNCRFGMMFWELGILCYAYAQYKALGYISTSMLVNVALQTAYNTKFFWWETGYYASMDIQHDRAGFYICWGCLVWVPGVYTSHTFYLTNHPVALSPPVALAIFAAGALSIWINYDSDRQRQEFRSTNGQIKVWGREPDFVRASYTAASGEERTSLLLASGYWGISRHFHYIPEILASFFWSLPALFHSPMPYFYVFYLTILLVDRAFRDDVRCAKKYGSSWVAYKRKVPYKIIPGII